MESGHAPLVEDTASPPRWMGNIKVDEEPGPSTDASLWGASAGVMAMQTLSFAEKVRQARQLEAVLEGFSSEDEDAEGSLDAAAESPSHIALARTARAAARCAGVGLWCDGVSEHDPRGLCY